MKRLTVDQVQTLRATQATWRRIAEDPAIRLAARESAARQVETIEAQLAMTRVPDLVLGRREFRHG